MKYEKPVIEFIEIEEDKTVDSGRDNGSSLGWGSCCYGD